MGGIFGNAHEGQNQNDVPEGEMNEAFWASQKAPIPDSGSRSGDDSVLPQGDYDANFFQDGDLPFAGADDDDDMDDEFADAREHFSPDIGGGGLGGNGMMTEVGMTGAFGGLTVTNPADLAFGTMLVTQSRRVRPEYVAYARVAKKVDVRRLKEEIWKGMDLERLDKVCVLFLLHSPFIEGLFGWVLLFNPFGSTPPAPLFSPRFITNMPNTN